MTLTPQQQDLCTHSRWDFSDLSALIHFPNPDYR